MQPARPPLRGRALRRAAAVVGHLGLCVECSFGAVLIGTVLDLCEGDNGQSWIEQNFARHAIDKLIRVYTT